jgi:hypothetical protein
MPGRHLPVATSMPEIISPLKSLSLLERPGAIRGPLNGTCAFGWTASGSFCLRSGGGGR